MGMAALCATWVEGVLGAEFGDFEAAFEARQFPLSARIALAGVIEQRTRTVGGTQAGSAPGALAAEARRIEQARLERLPGDPRGYQADLVTTWRTPLDSVEAVPSICSPCAGAGQVRCGQCQGSALVSCSACYGRGRRSCGRCYGNGSITRIVSDSYSAGGTRSVTDYCTACSGGTVMCFGCGGSGRTRCYGCTAGKVRCSPCAGTGRLTTLTSGESVITASGTIDVGREPDPFIREAAIQAPAAAFRHAALETPGIQEPGGAVFSGCCGCEDGRLRIADGSTRLVGIGPAGEAVCAAAALDDACTGYRDRAASASGDGLEAMLDFADGNRLAATQLLGIAERTRSKTIRQGLEARGLATQSPGERAMTQALLTEGFLRAASAALATVLEAHASGLAAREREVRGRWLRVYTVAAVLGLIAAAAGPALIEADANDRFQLILALAAGWAAASGLVCALAGWLQLRRLRAAERAILSAAPQNRRQIAPAPQPNSTDSATATSPYTIE